MTSPFSRYCLVAALLVLASPSTGAVEPVRHTVFSAGHRLAVWEKSPARPKAQILLLHGRTWSALPNFDLQVPGESLSFMDGLDELGYAVFALDARGYGGTPRDQSGWLTPDQAARDVAEVLRWMRRRQDSPETHLFGWSYGSMIAQLVVQRDSDLVSSVIFFGYPFDPVRHVPEADYPYPATAPSQPNTAKNAASDFITPGAISQAAIDAYILAALKTDPVRVDFKDLHQWAELSGSKVFIPSLLLQGEFDPLAPTEAQASFFSSIKHANKWWVVLPGGDHAALLETPRPRMLRVIDAFISGLN